MYGKAFKEVYEIIDNMSIENTKKLPKEFMNYIISNSDWNHKFVYNKSKSLENQKLQEETPIILTMIYLKYFATEKQKIDIIKQMKQNDIDDEKAKIEKYKIIEFMNNEKSNKKVSKSSYDYGQIIPVVFKEKWYERILKNVKKWFNIK